MQVRVKLHGLLMAVPADPDGLELSVPEETDVAGAVEILAETSPLFDARSVMAVIGGVKVDLDWILHDCEELHLYHLFSGG
jgi:hypothetical protein